MKTPTLLLLTLLLANVILAQTTETLKTYSPSGKQGTLKIDVTQQTKVREDYLQLKPHLLILNTEIVNVAESKRKQFLNMVEENNKIWQYRYLEHLCEHELAISRAQSIEGQMFIYRKKIHSGNLISAMLERELQHRLQTFFPFSACYAYRLNRSQEYTMADMANDFKPDWIISPTIFKADTVNDLVESSLQLEVWDANGDSLRINRIFTSRAKSLTESINNVISKAGAYLLGSIGKDKTFRQVARLGNSRGKYFEGFLEKHNQPEVKEIMTQRDLADGYIGGMMNKSKDRFLGFTLNKYIPDFEDKIPNKVYENPYEHIDVTVDMDPGRAQYKSMTYVGLRFEGKWLVKPINGDWIYTKDPLQARKVCMSRVSNLGIFIPDSTKLYPDFWKRGFFTPLDTSTLRFRLDTLKVKNWKTDLAVDKLRLAPYQGFPRSVAEELSREYTWKKALDWRVNIAENHLKGLFNDLEASRVRDIRFIDTEVRSFPVIHDYEMTRGLVALWVEEPWVKLSLRFFYWDQDNPDELYEWTYLPKVTFDKKSDKPKGKYLYEQMNKVIPWSFVRGFVDDQAFWQEKVLAKEEGAYKYLVKVTGD